MNDKINFFSDIKYNNLINPKINSFIKEYQTNNIQTRNNKFENFSLNNTFKNNKKELDNKIEDLLISYYYETIKFFKNSFRNYENLLLKSKNYIQKSQYNFSIRNNNKEYNKKYINEYNFNISEQDLINLKQGTINNNYLISQELNLGNFKVNHNINNELNNNLREGIEKNIKQYLGTNLESSNNIINNTDCPSFIPSNYQRTKEKENDLLRVESNDSLSKDKESDSTSAISEKDKKEEENKFEFPSKAVFNNNQDGEAVEYLVEMFGRKGWICKLCNNFNYETRNKCNRCGIMKKPKNIVDLKHRVELNSRKGEWICNNCRNLNYSFRTICNRCKIPKFNCFLSETINLKNKDIFNFQKCLLYSFSPSFNYFNNNVHNIAVK